MKHHVLFKPNSISPIPARSIADLELRDEVYKADFEITERFQAFSKELVRISLLGLAAYGFLIKLAADSPTLWQQLQQTKVVDIMGLCAFAVSAGCALLHGFWATKCLGHQLTISRYFGRLEGERWDDRAKESFREVIRYQQQEQKFVLKIGLACLVIATLALIIGAGLVAACSVIMLFNHR